MSGIFSNSKNNWASSYSAFTLSYLRERKADAEQVDAD